MKRITGAASLAALTLVMVAGGAQASTEKLCRLTGSYSDDYNSTTSIKGKSGSILNAAICSTPYTFKISDETQTGFTVMGKNKTKSCGKFTADLTFMGSCSVFGGTVTINGEAISDTFTKIKKGKVHEAPSALTSGLK